MDKSVGVNIDLLGNEAKNTRIENLAVIPSANPLTIGRLMYDTVSKRAYIDTGTEVYSLPAQFGTLLANKVLVTDINGFITTDTNFSWDTINRLLNVNGNVTLQGKNSLATQINHVLKNSLGTATADVTVYGNGAVSFGIAIGIGDKITVNGKVRVVGNTVSDGGYFGGNVTPTSTLQSGGTVSFPLRQISASTTFNSTDYTIEASGTAYNVVLPTAVGIGGRVYLLKNQGGQVKTLTTVLGELIDGITSRNVTSGNWLKVQSNGTNWTIIG